MRISNSGFQNIADGKLSRVQEFVQENQFACRLATVSLMFLHLGQYWHLATQDKLLCACILLGSSHSSAACLTFMALTSYYVSIIVCLTSVALLNPT